MRNSYSKARKNALRYLNMDEDSSMSYTDIAKRIVFKECSIVEDVDLSNRLQARDLVRVWSHMHEYRKPKHGTI